MKKKILVVEDEPHMMILLRSALETAGYDVDEAFCGNDVYERMRKAVYDLILLDFILPDTLGNEICKSVCKDAATLNVPIIVVTAFSTRSRERFLEEGAIDVVFKPVHLEELLDKVRALFKGKEGAHARVGDT